MLEEIYQTLKIRITYSPFLQLRLITYSLELLSEALLVLN